MSGSMCQWLYSQSARTALNLPFSTAFVHSLPSLHIRSSSTHFLPSLQPFNMMLSGLISLLRINNPISWTSWFSGSIWFDNLSYLCITPRACRYATAEMRCRATKRARGRPNAPLFSNSSPIWKLCQECI
jgi:hypothetical protein